MTLLCPLYHLKPGTIAWRELANTTAFAQWHFEGDIKHCLIKGNTVVLTMRYHSGTDYSGVVGEVNNDTLNCWVRS